MATEPSRLLAAAAAVTIVMLAPAAARADAGEAAKPGDAAGAQGGARPGAATDTPPPKPTRRGGFMVGVNVGAGVGSIQGYPNDVTKIGVASAYTATGTRPAGLIEAWFGGAFSDWFTFGVGFDFSSLFSTGGDKARMYGAIFRVDTFPLFALGGPFRDLGVRLDAGLGTASVSDPGGDKLVDGSFASIIGGGVFWEGLRAWKTNHGPILMSNYLWSDTARRPAIFLGWRTVLYTRP